MTKRFEHKPEREELERLINDAVEGMLNSADSEALEAELKHHPDLQKDYHTLMNIPDPAKAYSDVSGAFRDDRRMRYVQAMVRAEYEAGQPVGELIFTLFKRYGLAASLLVFGAISITNIIISLEQDGHEEIPLNEIFYNVNTDDSGEYLIYLDQWMMED